MARTRASTLGVAWVFGLSGAGFACGNLLLARSLEPTEYGLFALVLALIQIGVSVGPAGLDLLINRHRAAPRRGLLWRAALSGTVIATGLVTIAGLRYSVPTLCLALLFLSSVIGAINWTAAAFFQSRNRLRAALWISQNQNLVLVVAAIVVIASGAEDSLLPLSIVAIGYTLSAVVSWSLAVREFGSERATALSFREGLSGLGVNGAELVMAQMDRLLIPVVLGLRELGTFATLAATVGAPFKVLQLGATYSFLPRMRSATTVAERWRRFRSEVIQVAVVTILGSLAIWLLARPVARLFVGDKYELSGALILAAVVAGGAKVIGALATAAVAAVAHRRQLTRLAAWNWVAVGLSVAGALVGSRWGLPGVVGGVAAGWIFRALAALALLISSLGNPELLDRLEVVEANNSCTAGPRNV